LGRGHEAGSFPRRLLLLGPAIALVAALVLPSRYEPVALALSTAGFIAALGALRQPTPMQAQDLDELPQLMNIVRGEMSLVGPRPTSFDVTTYALWQTERVEFRPGITGPWQVYGRNSMEFDERCRLEITFFRRPSLRRELWLLPATIGSMLRRTGVA
jgi:hypothetical protein